MFNNLIASSSATATGSANPTNIVFSGFLKSLWSMVDWLPVWYFPTWFWISLGSIIGGYFIWFVYVNFIE